MDKIEIACDNILSANKPGEIACNNFSKIDYTSAPAILDLS